MIAQVKEEKDYIYCNYANVLDTAKCGTNPPCASTATGPNCKKVRRVRIIQAQYSVDSPGSLVIMSKDKAANSEAFDQKTISQSDQKAGNANTNSNFKASNSNTNSNIKADAHRLERSRMNRHLSYVPCEKIESLLRYLFH